MMFFARATEFNWRRGESAREGGIRDGWWCACLEVGSEQEIGGIVETPLARLLDRSSVADAQTKDAVDLPGTVLQLLVAAVLVDNIILESVVEGSTALVYGVLVVGLDGKDAQVLAGDVETGNGPGLKGTVLVAFVQGVDDVSPSLVDAVPVCGGLERVVGAAVAVAVAVAQGGRVLGGEHVTDGLPVGDVDVDPGLLLLPVQLQVGVLANGIAEVGEHAVGIGGLAQGIQTAAIVLRRLGGQGGRQGIAVLGIEGARKVGDQGVHYGCDVRDQSSGLGVIRGGGGHHHCIWG